MDSTYREVAKPTKAAADTAQAAQEANKLNERIIKGSYAAIIHPGIGGEANTLDGLQSGIDVALANVGRIAATNLTAEFYMVRQTVPEYMDIGKPQKVTLSKPQVMGSEQSRNREDRAILIFRTNIFSASDISEIRAMREVVKVSGSFHYDNGFGDTVSASECWIYGVLQDIEGRTAGSGWFECEEGKNDIAAAIRRQREHYRKQ
jgi:hypothetical protein